MLRRSSSLPPSLGGLVEHECPRCGRAVELPLGEICDECESRIQRRAGRVARWVALGTTALVTLYVILQMPPDRTARIVGVMAIGIWYILTYRITTRVMREWLR